MRLQRAHFKCREANSVQLNVRLSMFSFTRTEILLLLSFLFGSFGVALWLTAPDGPKLQSF